MRVELSANSLLTLRDLDQPSIIYVYIRIYTHIYTYICWASGVSILVSLSRRLALARAPPRFTKSTTQLRNERRSCGLTNTPHAPTKMATHSGSKTPLRPSPQRNPFRPPPSFFSAEYQTAHMDIPPSKPTTMSEPGTPMQPIYPRCSMCGIKAVKPPIEMCLKCKFLILVLVILLLYIVLTISKKQVSSAPTMLVLQSRGPPKLLLLLLLLLRPRDPTYFAPTSRCLRSRPRLSRSLCRLALSFRGRRTFLPSTSERGFGIG